LAKPSEALLRYDERTIDPATLARELARGELVSVQLAQGSPTEILLELYAPKFCGSRHNEWTCIVEGPDESIERLYRGCLEGPDLSYPALYFDDVPDYEVEHITVETFPWDDWRLKQAAVRRPDRTIEERRC
jgi:hypothetical protein